MVDSNVLLDVLEEDPIWYEWSANQLQQAADASILIINTVIYSEISIGFREIEELERVLLPEMFQRRPIPWEAAFLAGKCYMRYRKLGGTRRSPLPDFFIGAHAAVEKLTLLTRDATRYRTYFPSVKLIAP
ncbi:type II toxin-antitoxin system VapC family toxin [Geomonas propionica]|uniref:Type II toxin-antitoxin system VapC family toxin n=1 Tax=Geomonas propionica TaxID=2798582 RepID=A0ABS0YKN3_9BACT|nr:type II toxin-antitoxin system VapC family toxin [Geomonas propionica]MBJ6798539.1 type II toxin-antitoxin system VapC family toxin [Geomonas propionica]